jgi:hypothetical protein
MISTAAYGLGVMGCRGASCWSDVIVLMAYGRRAHVVCTNACGRAVTTDSPRLGRSAVQLALATVAIGAVSYALIFVGSRRISSDNMANLLSLWAIMNTTVLSLVIPIEILAPRLLRGQSRTVAIGDGALVLLTHGGALGVLGALVSLGVFFFSTGGGSLRLAVAAIAYCTALGLWSGTRARLVGIGDYATVMWASVATAAIAILGLVTFFVGKFNAPALLLSCVMAAYGIGAIGTHRVGIGRRGPSEQPALSARASLGAANYKMLATLVGATFVTLVFNNGGLALARSFGMDSRRIVVYAATLNIVRIPLMLANNVTPPINLKIVDLAAANRWVDVRRMFLVTLAAFAAILAAGLALTTVLGPFFVRLLVGGTSPIESRLVVLALVGEGLIWLTVLPRILFVVLGTQRSMSVAWVGGLVCFAVWIALPIGAEWKVVGGPIVGGIATLVVGLALAVRSLGQRIAQPDHAERVSTVLPVLPEA